MYKEQNTRRLSFEFSAARCRKFELGWRPFTFVPKKLEEKGFTHVMNDRAAWEPGYWRTGVSSFQASLDAMVFACRQGSKRRIALEGSPLKPLTRI